MYLVEGQSVIYGEMDVVVAEVGVTMCAEVHMFVKSTIPRHAKSCKGKVQKTDGLSQRPASTIGFKSSGHDAWAFVFVTCLVSKYGRLYYLVFVFYAILSLYIALLGFCPFECFLPKCYYIEVILFLNKIILNIEY